MLKKRHIFLFIILIIGLILGGGYYYLSQSYQPLAGNEQYLNQDKVSEHENYYIFQSSKQNDSAVIFYPGGKVEETAYAPLADMISEAGYPTFLVKMPFNLAIFAKDRADNILDQYGDNIENWYIAGHSLGGAMAASYLADNNLQNFAGIIFLASYPPQDVDFTNTNIKVLSINATEDQVVDRNRLEAGRNNLPSDAIFNIIKGGNHAGFGNYGPQSGDGESSITKKEQWEITVNYINQFIQN